MCEGVWALISAACHFVCLSLSLPLLCSLYVALLCFALLCCACAWWFAFNHDLLSFCLFPSFLSFPDLHIHSSYLLHLPFLHWEWQAGIPLTNSVICTQQTPVRTLRGQSSAQHLPPCVWVFVWGGQYWCCVHSYCSCYEPHICCMSCFSPLGFDVFRLRPAPLIKLIKVNMKCHS